MSGLEPIADLNEKQARAITERIRDGQETLWVLLEEAQQGRAWVALGYKTWVAYLKAEFGMTDRNARRLSVQGAVIRELGVAAGVELAPNVVSARTAAVIAPAIESVKAEVSAATKGTSNAKRPEIVREVVDSRADARVRIEDETPAQGLGPGRVARPDAFDKELAKIPTGMDLCPTCDGSGYVHKAPRAVAKVVRSAKVEAKPTGKCVHPPSSVSKGFCYGCGQNVSKK